MSDHEITITGPDGVESEPFTLDDLKNAAQMSPDVLTAGLIVTKDGKCSTSYIQRKMAIGYNKAARIVEELEEMGVVSKTDHVGKRKILMDEMPASKIKQAVGKMVNRSDETPQEIKGSAPMGHNSDKVTDSTTRIAAQELRQFIERIERLEAEKKDIADAQKEVYAESKGRGYDNKVMRKIVAMRKRDANDLAEEMAVLDMYCSALGMN